jgi:hypothetical protein
MKYLLSLIGLSNETRAIPYIKDLIINDIKKSGNEVDVMICTNNNNEISRLKNEYNPIDISFHEDNSERGNRNKGGLKFLQILERYIFLIENKTINEYDYMITTRFDIILSLPFSKFPYKEGCFNFTCHACGPYTYNGIDYIDTDNEFWIFPANIEYIKRIHKLFSVIEYEKQLTSSGAMLQAFHRCRGYLNYHNVETNIMFPKTLNYLMNGTPYYQYPRHLFDKKFVPNALDNNDFKNPKYRELLSQLEKTFIPYNWF